MIGSLINLLTRRPDLIIDHVASYAALAQDEIGSAKRRVIKRVAAAVVALACGTAGIVLSGVALMLALTSSQLANVWVLYTAPAVVLLVCIIAARVAIIPGADLTGTRGTLGDQFRRDLDALKMVTGARS